MSPQQRPQAYIIQYLDPSGRGPVQLRVNARTASRYGEYLNDVKRAKEQNSSAPLRKWERRTFEDLRKQRWVYNSDLDDIKQLEDDLTDDEQEQLEEEPIESP